MTSLRNVLDRRALAALASLCLATAGCGGIGSYCNDRSECEGGSEADLEACDLVFTARSDRAELAGCLEKFDEYLDCLSDKSTCEDDQYRAPEECSELDEELARCEQQ